MLQMHQLQLHRHAQGYMMVLQSVQPPGRRCIPAADTHHDAGPRLLVAAWLAANHSAVLAPRSGLLCAAVSLFPAFSTVPCTVSAAAAVDRPQQLQWRASGYWLPPAEGDIYTRSSTSSSRIRCSQLHGAVPSTFMAGASYQAPVTPTVAARQHLQSRRHRPAATTHASPQPAAAGQPAQRSLSATQGIAASPAADQQQQPSGARPPATSQSQPTHQQQIRSPVGSQKKQGQPHEQSQELVGLDPKQQQQQQQQRLLQQGDSNQDDMLQEGSWLGGPPEPDMLLALQQLMPSLVQPPATSHHRHLQQPLTGRLTTAQASADTGAAAAAGHQHLTAADPHLTHLQQLLGISYEAATQLALLCPEVVALPPATAAAHWRQLQQLLPVSSQRLAVAVTRHPWLLLLPEAVVPGRLQQLAEALKVPKALRQALSKLPPEARLVLVVADPSAAAARLALLRQALGLRVAAAQQLLLAVPGVLLRQERVLVSSMEALEEVLQVRLSKVSSRLLLTPQLLLVPPDSLYSRAADLQEQLQLNEAGLAEVLKRFPGALGAPPPRASQQLAVLQRALDISNQEAQNLLLQVPEVLGFAPGGLAALLQIITSTFRLTPQDLEQVVQFNPQLLLLSVGKLQQRLGAFTQLVQNSPSWRPEFKLLMAKPANVARTLTIDTPRLQRLIYLRRTGRDLGITLKQALGMSQPEFARMYPRFKPWIQEQQQRRRLEAAAAAAGGASPRSTLQQRPAAYQGASFRDGFGQRQQLSGTTMGRQADARTRAAGMLYRGITPLPSSYPSSGSSSSGQLPSRSSSQQLAAGGQTAADDSLGGLTAQQLAMLRSRAARPGQGPGAAASRVSSGRSSSSGSSSVGAGGGKAGAAWGGYSWPVGEEDEEEDDLDWDDVTASI